MSRLTVTLIDVGWGDSILLESESGGNTVYGLIDSNDTTSICSSYIFLKRHFEKLGVDKEKQKIIFSFVLLSHDHADHGQGLKAIMREFGTERFWYPKSLQLASLGHLLSYANTSNKVGHHESLDNSKLLPNFGDVSMKILWPREEKGTRQRE
jgi:beta-lactamase superfamily II metal-dependent hydrolase